jgi:hypothetical protein
VLLNQFKISIWRLGFILIFSILAGYYIYTINSVKVNYVIQLDSGKLISENYCRSFLEIPNQTILNDYAVNNIQKLIFLDYSLKNSLNNKAVFYYIKDRQMYQLVIPARHEINPETLNYLVQNAKKYITLEEERIFKEKFSKMKIHCDEKIFPVFAYAPAKFDDPDLAFVAVPVYRKSLLWFGALAPFIFLYLVAIIFGYIRSNYSDLSRRN